MSLATSEGVLVILYATDHFHVMVSPAPLIKLHPLLLKCCIHYLPFLLCKHQIIFRCNSTIFIQITINNLRLLHMLLIAVVAFDPCELKITCGCVFYSTLHETCILHTIRKSGPC